MTPNRDRLTVLKLGGSAITHKETPFKANTKTINRLAREIAIANVPKLLIVHGGGGFGHPLAKSYKIMEGYHSASQLLGFSKTHEAMTMLNKIVVNALISNNVPAVSVSPSSCIMTRNGRISILEEKPLLKMLDLGFAPVLYGDTVIDSEKGFTILSGDQLIASLAMGFKAENIVVGVDVDGLYTTDPKTNVSSKLILRLNLVQLEQMRSMIAIKPSEETKIADVTGSMLGKVNELLPAVQKGISVRIVNATKPHRVLKALKGERVRGTVIKRK